MDVEEVCAIVQELVGREVLPEEDIFDVGGDSLTVIELAVRLSGRAGFEVDVSVIVDATSFIEIAGNVP